MLNIGLNLMFVNKKTLQLIGGRAGKNTAAHIILLLLIFSLRDILKIVIITI